MSTTFSSVLSASWEIDLWGRIRRETEAARANLLATEEARRGVTLTLISSVIASYVTLLDLDEQLRVARRRSKAAGNRSSCSRRGSRAAGSPSSKCRRCAADIEAARCSSPGIEQAIATQEHALSVLVGRNPGPDRPLR